MSPVNEVKTITAIETALSRLDDAGARDRILKWAWDKFSSKPGQYAETQTGAEIPARIQPGEARKRVKAKGGSKTRKKMLIVKDLNLSMSDKKSFKDFVNEKKPLSNQEKCTVALYYLQNEIEVENVTVNHIYTCYKNVNWRTVDLRNILFLTASRKGWVNTSDTENITITIHGEALVEHDLPHKLNGR